MDFTELAARRYSCRAYLSDNIEEKLLTEVLEAGRLAPSACNIQPVHFIVVKNKEDREALAESYKRDWLRHAPIIIVVCIDNTAAWKRFDKKSYADVDAAIAMDHIILCAASLGLGTCWIGAFNPEIVRKVLNLPQGIEPLAMTPLGKPAQQLGNKSRKKLEEMVHWEKW